MNSVHSIFHRLKIVRLLAVCLLGFLTIVMRAEVAIPMESLTEDELIYRDGDRLRGHLVREEEAERCERDSGYDAG